MNFHFDLDYKNLPNLIILIVNYLIIAFVCYKIYKRKEKKPKIWKAVLVIIFAAFAFTINFQFYHSTIQLPILPLGVWIMYWIISKKKPEQWATYRGFAWSGFLLKFVFIFTSLIIYPLNSIMYPKDKLETFISDIKETNIIVTDPNENAVALNKKKLLNSLDSFKVKEIMNIKWYNEMYVNPPNSKPIEQFPYLLLRTKPKIGSNLHTMIYIEKDGKGFFIMTKERHYYFRSDMNIISPIDGGNNHVSK